MRAVVQRVLDCTVSVDGCISAQICRGILVYLGVAIGDGIDDVKYMVDKIANLRIFPDQAGKMNHSVREIAGQVCVVSQFTLMGDARKGRRPSWDAAAAPELAVVLYQEVCTGLQKMGLQVGQGVFQADMAVNYTNDGPITVLLDSSRLF